MQVFKINRNIEVVCRSENTRYGFRHLATLVVNGRECESAKACYYNRTWERFEFESVLKGVLAKTRSLSAGQGRTFKKWLTNYQAPNPFKSIAAVARLGEVFGKTEEEKNAWKKRMLVAGLEKKGLTFPDNWDELPEEEKKARLDGAISQIS